MTDRKTLDLAREWAEWAEDNPSVPVGHIRDLPRAAADLISSLPDEWVDAKGLRDVIELWSTEPLTSETAPFMVEQLRELLPTPPAPRTLAAMPPEERHECQWMQAEVLDNEDWIGGKGVITYIRESENNAWANVMDSEGNVWDGVSLKYVRPLSDLPTLRWPGNEPEEAEDTAAEPASTRPDGCCGACPETVGGGVDCTCADNPRCPNHQPRPEDVPVGEPWQVEIDGETAIGYRNDPESNHPWHIAPRNMVDYSRSFWEDDDVTLVARLVPETTEQDDEPVHLYRDKDGDEWECIDGGWFTGDTHAKRVAKREYRVGRSSLPAEYGPYTRVEDTNE